MVSQLGNLEIIVTIIPLKLMSGITFITTIYLFIVILQANPSSCPCRRPPSEHQKKTVFCGTKCTCPGSWLSSCNPQLSNLCVECYTTIHIIIIIINYNNIINTIIIIIIIIITKIPSNIKFNGGGDLMIP